MLFIALVVALMAILAANLVALGAFRHRDATAQALAHGYQSARALTEEEAEDDDLAADEGAAGALWARAHRGRTASECPSYTAAFEKSCAAATAKAPLGP
jgi:hypothetical protein